MGVLEECIAAEEMAFGCTGITTAVGGTTLGVSPVHSVGCDNVYLRCHHTIFLHLKQSYIKISTLPPPN